MAHHVLWGATAHTVQWLKIFSITCGWLNNQNWKISSDLHSVHLFNGDGCIFVFQVVTSQDSGFGSWHCTHRFLWVHLLCAHWSSWDHDIVHITLICLQGYFGGVYSCRWLALDRSIWCEGRYCSKEPLLSRAHTNRRHQCKHALVFKFPPKNLNRI